MLKVTGCNFIDCSSVNDGEYMCLRGLVAEFVDCHFAGSSGGHFGGRCFSRILFLIYFHSLYISQL
jgi:hypothetical protein